MDSLFVTCSLYISFGNDYRVLYAKVKLEIGVQSIFCTPILFYNELE